MFAHACLHCVCVCARVYGKNTKIADIFGFFVVVVASLLCFPYPCSCSTQQQSFQFVGRSVCSLQCTQTVRFHRWRRNICLHSDASVLFSFHNYLPPHQFQSHLPRVFCELWARECKPMLTQNTEKKSTFNFEKIDEIYIDFWVYEDVPDRNVYTHTDTHKLSIFPCNNIFVWTWKMARRWWSFPLPQIQHNQTDILQFVLLAVRFVPVERHTSTST